METKVHICHLCKTVWIKTRPFVCDKCRANVFIKEYEATPENIEQIRGDSRFRVLEGVENMS